MESDKALRVYMLGGFEMYYDGAPLQLKKKLTSKPVQLLQLLLFNRENGVSRAAVMEALFGQDTVIDAANTLNATVSQLRRLLRETHLPDENYIHFRIDRYFFESTFPTWVDTEEVLFLRRQADLSHGEERSDFLYRLCDLYHGRLLPELDGENWVEIAKAEYQRIFRDSLNELCAILKNHHSHEGILQLTGIAARLFPFDEWQVWQQESLLALGRVREAHDLYLQTEKLYMTELGSPPPERMRSRFRKPEKETWRRTESAETVRKWLTRENRENPKCVPLPGFLYVYNMVNRMRTPDNPFFLMLCTLSVTDARRHMEDAAFQAAMDHLESILTGSLRFEDVFTRYSRSQFLVILPGAVEANIGIIADRLQARFAVHNGQGLLRLDCQPLPAEEISGQENL